MFVEQATGGQVFALTQFNNGCVCVSNCLFASLHTCFHEEYTLRDMDSWMDGSKLEGLL